MDNGNSNGMVMPVAPIGNYGYGTGMGGYPFMPMFFGTSGNGGNGMGGWGDGWWVILFLFALMGNGFGGWGGFGGGMNGLGLDSYLFNTQTQNDVNRGFQNSMISNQISDVQSSISNGFAQAEVSNCNRAINQLQTDYTNQIASMNQRFADNQNLSGQLNNIAMGLQNCCCENRAATADLKYTVATEACADRAAVSDALRDVLTANTASTQRILDQMCQDKIDAKNEKIAELQNKLSMADLRASQIAQTAEIQRGQVAEVDALYNRLQNCPVPCEPVYGRQPIFTCQNNGCGCGYGGYNGNF